MEMMQYEKCNMKKIQHEKNINCHSGTQKTCTRIVYYSAQTDNGSSVDGPLCTGTCTIEMLLMNNPLMILSKVNWK